MPRSVSDPFEGMPHHVRLSFAHLEAAEPDQASKERSARLSIEAPDPKRIVVTLEYSEPGGGFGHFTLLQTPEGVFLDTETSDPERVKRAFGMLVDRALTDQDADPERHERYKAAFQVRCGPACGVCFPPSDVGGDHG